MKTDFLENLAEIQYGYPFDSKHFKEQGSIRVIRIRDIKKPEVPTFFDGAYDRQYIIDSGDIIVGMDGEFNCTIWAFGPALLNQRLARIIPKKSVSKEYLYYLLKMKLKELEQRTSSSTVKHLLDTHLRKIEIPVLSSERQAAVAEVLTKVDLLRQSREQANLMASKILQAVFLQMFGDHQANTSKVPIRKLKEISILITKGESPLWRGDKYQSKGIPIIRIKNIKDFRIVLDDADYITEVVHQRMKRSQLQADDLVISIAGTLGRCAIVTADVCPANMNQDQALVRLKKDIVHPIYAVQALSTDYVRQQIENIRRGATRLHLNLKQVGGLQIPLPEKELQEEFVTLARKVETLRGEQNVSTEKISSLFDSLSSRAFKGKLLTEGHTKEPTKQEQSSLANFTSD